ncbi:MAG TPA: hypothetical protein VK060_17880 [Ruania sp.]|nr:hypothetical protein [Ruania sp.]
MNKSPMSRDIEYLIGDGETIESRGKQIESLGKKMIESATILEAVKDSEDGQYGKAVDKLREEIGEAHDTLREAGELYQPVGPHIADYGAQVSESQPLIKSKVDECVQLWNSFEGLPGSVTGPDSGADDEDAAESEYQAKKQAYDDWNEAAGEYDSLVSTWELAYGKAESGISDDMAGKIRDPDWFWDAIDFLVDALGWVALAVGILAIIVGGPFIALAAILGAAIFALTLLQYLGGEASLGDMFWATIGIVPFGKAGLLFRGAKGSFFKEMFKGFSKSNFTTMLDDFGAMGGRMSAANGFWKSAGAMFDGGGTGALVRSLTGKDPKGWTEMAEQLDMESLSIKTQLGNGVDMIWQTMTTFTGHMSKIDSTIAKISGNDPVKDGLPVPIRIAL